MMGIKERLGRNLVLVLASLTLATTSVAPAHAQGNLIVNGSFEDGGGSFNGWTIRNLYPSESHSIGTYGAYVTNVPDGSYYAAWYGPGNQYGGISQQIHTIAGAYYALSLSAVCFDGTNFASVTAGNLVEILNFTSTVPVKPYALNPPYNSTWQDFNFTFQATSSVTLVSLAYMVQTGNYSISAWGDGGLDNISVVQIVPEPSTLALAGMVLLGSLATRRFRFGNK